jgi:hypothetical protein
MDWIALLQDKAVDAPVGLVVAGALALAHRKVRGWLNAALIIHSSRESRNLRTVAHEALARPTFYEFLGWYYGVHPYEHDGIKYPAVVFPLSIAGTQERLNSVLRPWPSGTAFLSREGGDYVSYDERFLSRRKRSGTVENRQTFCARSLDMASGATPAVEGGLIGTYEDCLATTDSLEQELLSAFGKDLPAKSDFQEFANRLPQRNALTQFCKRRGLNPVLDGAGRSAALAVSTLTLAYRESDGEFVTFLAPRSAKTAVHAHLLHVAPSGMFQPSKDWAAEHDERYAEEWDLRHHVIREFAEELFDIEVDKTEGETPRRFYKIQEVQELNDMLQSGGARLFVTGVLVNLLNLRPEICTLLVITDKHWYRRHDEARDNRKGFKRNWEFMQDEDARERQRGDTKGRLFWRQPITGRGAPLSDMELRRALGDVSAVGFVVPGAIALWLGMARFRKEYAELTSAAC